PTADPPGRPARKRARPPARRATSSGRSDVPSVFAQEPLLLNSTQRPELYSELAGAVLACRTVHSRRERHAPGEEDPDAFFDADVRKRGVFTPAYDDVPQIEMVRRHVYRDKRLWSGSAVDCEFLRQKAQRESFPSLEQDDALESELVVR